MSTNRVRKLTCDRHRETTVEERLAGLGPRTSALRTGAQARDGLASSDGAIAIDNAGNEADPPPVTTIACHTWHLIVACVDS